MPYIKPRRRPSIALGIYDACEDIKNAGELNFAITKLIMYYLKELHNGLDYEGINEVIGVLECVKQEFYRRQAAPYENAKIQENGDVY